MPTITRAINNLQVSFGKISTYPTIGLNVANPQSIAHLVIPQSGIKGVIIQAASGQSVNIIEVQDNLAAPLWSVSSTGSIMTKGVVTAGSGSVALTDATGHIINNALPVVDIAHGGTNVTSLTSNSILTANSGGTAVAPLVGTASGQVATWNGTAWAATTPGTGGNVSTGIGTTTGTITKWSGATIITDSVITEFTGGLIGINKAVPIGKVHIQDSTITIPTLIIQRMTGQTAELTRWLSEDGTTTLASISPNGLLGLGSAYASNAFVTIGGTLATAGTDLYAWNGTGSTLQPADTYSVYFQRIGGTIATTTAATNPGAYGIYVNTLSKTGTGTITTAYGAYVNVPTAGAQNIAGYFGGALQVGASFTSNVMMGVGGTVPLLASNGSYGAYIAPTLNPDNTLGAFSLRTGGVVNVTVSNTAVAYGIAIDPMTKTGSGTVTTAYGLFVQNPTIGTNNYAANFGGSVGIGAANSVATRSDSLIAISGTYIGSAAAIGINENIVLTPTSANVANFISIAGSVATGSSTTTGNAASIYIAPITKTGTGTVPIYYGLYVDGSSLATQNFAAYFNGNVGINKTVPTASLHAQAQSTSTIPMIAQAIAGQSTSTQEWWTSSGLQMSVTSSGTLFVNPTAPALANIISRAISSPTQHLIQFQNNGGTSIGSVGPTGNVGIGADSVIDRALQITGTITSASRSAYGIYEVTTLSPLTNNDAAGLIMLNTVATGASSTVNNAYGLSITASTKSGTGTITNNYGTYIVGSSAGTNNYAEYISTGATGVVGLSVNGVNGQTASIFSVRNSTPSTVFEVNANGWIGIGTNNSTSSGASLIFGGTQLASNPMAVSIGGSLRVSTTNGNGSGLRISPTFDTLTNVMANAYGIYIPTLIKFGSNAITNAFGINIETPTVGTNNYSAFFGAKVNINSTIGTQATVSITGHDANQDVLDITGASGQTNALITAGTFSVLPNGNTFVGLNLFVNSGTISTNAISTTSGMSNFGAKLSVDTTGNNGTLNFSNFFQVRGTTISASLSTDTGSLGSFGIATTGGQNTNLAIHGFRHTAGSTDVGVGFAVGIDANSVSRVNGHFVGFTEQGTGIDTLLPGATLGVNGTVIASGLVTASAGISTTTITASSTISGASITSTGLFNQVVSNAGVDIGLRASNTASGGKDWIIYSSATGSGFGAGAFTIYDNTAFLPRLTIASTGNATFANNLFVTGALSKGSGTFKIDHPLHPTEKILYHGFVEAPRYDLIYRGNVNLVNGTATIDIDSASGMEDGTFAVLTKNVDIFVTNKTGWARVKVTDIHDDNDFTILCEDETSSDTVTWLVIAERNDAFIRTNEGTDESGSLIVEVDKREATEEEKKLLIPVTREVFVDTEEELVDDTTIEEPIVSLIGLRGYPLHPEAIGMITPTRIVTLHRVVRKENIPMDL